VIEVPVEGKALPGYLLKPAIDVEPRKTLIMLGGGDTFGEDLYGYIGPAALRRGYNLALVDLPQQGIVPFDGLVARLVSRPDVDVDRLGVFGISGGGYFAPRAAMYEKRIKAMIAFSMMFDAHAVWTETMNVAALAAAERRGLLSRGEALGIRKIKTARVLFDIYKWKYGVDTIQGILDVARGCTVDPGLITCPTLILVAQQEYEEFSVSRSWQDEALAKIDNSNKKLAVMPRDEGADSHAGGTNVSLVAQVVFDWLDEVFHDASADR
jgi:hypothetical protein